MPTLAETSSDFIGPLNPHIGTMSYPLPERRRVSLLRRLWRYVTNLTQTHCPTC